MGTGRTPRVSATRAKEIVDRRRAEDEAGRPTAEGGTLLDLADEVAELREQLRDAEARAQYWYNSNMEGASDDDD